jgi:acetyltransferase-like isoleucine patch superfamily enzyme
MSRFVEVGRGSVITVGNILNVNVRLGQHVHVNLDCTIGHDAVLEDYATLAPGVHVSGWVFIKEGAYIGTGAVIINGTEDKPLEIGAYAVVGAGAVVTKDVPPGVTVVGVPAKPLSKVGLGSGKSG